VDRGNGIQPLRGMNIMKFNHNFYKEPVFWGALFFLAMFITMLIDKITGMYTVNWWLALLTVILATSGMLYGFLKGIYPHHDDMKNGKML
jgi:hypothetical protein